MSARIIYGINPVTEGLKSHPEDFKEVIILSGKTGKEVESVKKIASQNKIALKKSARQDMDRLARTQNHQGIVAVLKEFRYVDIDEIPVIWKRSGEKAFILVLDSIEDPQNLGSLIRTANAAGVHGVIIPKNRAAGITPAATKASAGATEYTKISQVTNLTAAIDDLKKQGVWVVGMEGNTGKSIYDLDLDMDMAIIIGSEGKGMRRLIKEKCDFLASIPMKGDISSLNASVAGAAVMFEVLRQRQGKKNQK
ncbi:MAG: 23S rRNA (guanosine(2251)-2'-O)-methyltransferase RlmB [Deltaproteobacteria bacterium GWC2_42_11]|nr:MAG: 23S rRNA (guanosine(2251)-2'-O)-methyltransferase RlmB [Deltaproteobacteria bacterium GWC2_42_11]HBO83865.1 23S rRNA (guanosine(2251)-2'-O)-methyltransferase RlmB [Deltaproteobacteria bacterium]